jgi:hypothetical protein
MSVTDRQAEWYGADAPRADLQPCFNDATHGITAGDCTQHLCLDHVPPTLYGTSGNVFVYPLQARRRCEYVSALRSPSAKTCWKHAKELCSLPAIYQFRIGIR